MIHKKKKEEDKFRLFRPYSRPISAVSGKFQPFPACFGRIGRRPIQPDMANTARFWPNQPGSARIEADSARIEPHRRESSRVGANPRKKKKNADADRHAGNRVGHGCGTSGAASVLSRPTLTFKPIIASKKINTIQHHNTNHKIVGP